MHTMQAVVIQRNGRSSSIILWSCGNKFPQAAREEEGERRSFSRNQTMHTAATASYSSTAAALPQPLYPADATVLAVPELRQTP